MKRFAVIPFFLFLLLSLPVYAYLPTDINTTIITTINRRGLSCINATADDSNIYCYLATAQEYVYQYDELGSLLKTCDISGSISDLTTVGGINSTHTLISYQKNIAILNISDCTLYGGTTNILNAYNNKLLEYYDPEQFVYSGKDAETFNVTNVTGMTTVFNSPFVGYNQYYFPNYSDNTTVYLLSETEANLILDYSDPNTNISVPDTWGVHAGGYYSMVKIDSSTTWLYFYQTEGAISTQTQFYRVNFTHGLASSTPVGASDVLWDYKNAFSGVGNLVGLSVSEAYIFFALLISIGLGLFVYFKTKQSTGFIITMLLSFVVCWALGLVPSYIILIMGLLIIAIIIFNRKGG